MGIRRSIKWSKFATCSSGSSEKLAAINSDIQILDMDSEIGNQDDFKNTDTPSVTDRVNETPQAQLESQITSKMNTSIEKYHSLYLLLDLLKSDGFIICTVPIHVMKRL
eukprot:NODE_163_length_14820_cov_0.686502.p3 type:complete len:109 gc:universal NODE_163_length_14820_cov_0.686502:5302-4976(-)